MKKRKILLCVLMAAASMNLLSGCKAGGGSGSGSGQESVAYKTDVELSAVLEGVQTAYGEDYIPNMDYDEQMMLDLFGIKEEMVEGYFAQGPMISVQIDTFVGVLAKDGQADTVEATLKEYQKRQVEDAVQYPMNLAKANSAQVVRYGNYVFFVMLGTPSMEAEEQGEEAALESAKENNQIALDAIAACFE